ncbi:MAG: hypothetical protein AMXMBFR22_14230 [Phycisphaerae bacterium]
MERAQPEEALPALAQRHMLRHDFHQRYAVPDLAFYGIKIAQSSYGFCLLRKNRTVAQEGNRRAGIRRAPRQVPIHPKSTPGSAPGQIRLKISDELRPGPLSPGWRY